MKRTLAAIAALVAAATLTVGSAGEAQAKCWAPTTAPSTSDPSNIELWC
jgi:hypothetical protein